MKQKLFAAKKMLSLRDVRQSLTQEDLNFITGGDDLLSGSGTSSTSGSNCCDGTCVCKTPPPPPLK